MYGLLFRGWLFYQGIGIQNWSSVPGFNGLCVAEVANCFLIEHGSVPEHFLPARE